MEIPTNKQLFDFILDSFNEKELDALCMDHLPEASYEFGSGMSLKEKVKELIDYCNWHGIRERLLVALQQERGEKYQTFLAQMGSPSPRPDLSANPPAPPVDKNQQYETQAHVLYQQVLQAQTDHDWLQVLTLTAQIEMILPNYRDVAALKAVAFQLLQKPGVESVSPAKTLTSQPSIVVSDRFVHEKTGLEFVRISAGTFLYGQDKKVVDLPEYWICKTPVTNRVYQKFIEANPSHEVPKMWLGGENNWDPSTRTFKPELAEHPVVIVSWYEAVTFCEWAGLQLPTEAQWEKAARGTDGRSYPWGNDVPTETLCNFNHHVAGTTPAGRYSPQGDSPYGCVDMSGNVWEWCLNKYGKPEDTSIDQSDETRVMRGGAWPGDLEGLHTTYRLGDYGPDFRFRDIGFRPVLVRP